MTVRPDYWKRAQQRLAAQGKTLAPLVNPPGSNDISGSLICPKCGSAHITTVSGQGLRATCRDCGRIGGDHEFLADEQGTKICPICLCETTFRHDHQPDNSGLDDGPPLNEPRKRAELKPTDVMRDIRDSAWATRRAKYGERGHR